MFWRLAVGAFAIATAVQQLPPRDARPDVRAGTARVRGVVLLDDAAAKPLRRAHVTLTGGALPVGRTTITADDGSFEFDLLPGGRYTLGASREGFVAMNHGATRTGRPGRPIEVGEGRTQTITLRLPRGSVLTGVLTGADGRPAPGIEVVAMRSRLTANGQRQMLPTGRTSRTDDRGSFRIFGLAAGTYLVAANRQSTLSSGDAQLLSASEVRRALEEVHNQSPVLSGSAESGPQARTNVRIGATYYPGTADAAQANPVTLAAGEERSGLDFQLQMVPLATVSGTLIPVASGQHHNVTLTRQTDSPVVDTLRSAHPDTGGRFRFTGVAPGRYTIIGSGLPDRGGPEERTDSLPQQWASLDVDVNGQDVFDVGLTLQPGLSLAGQIAFVAGIVPGAYHLGGTMPGVRSAIGGWWLKSIMLRGRELLDAILDLRESADDLIVVFSDRASELAGTATHAEGDPVTNQFVVVFPADRSWWFPGSRRVAGVSLGPTGNYSIRNLPAGDYLTVVTDDVESGEWFDPSILERLAERASRLSIAENEKKTFNVTVR